MFFKLFSIKINFFLIFPCFCWFFCCLCGVSNRFYGFGPLFCFIGWCVLTIVVFVNGLPKILFIIKMAVKTPSHHKIIERRFQVLVAHTYSYTYLYIQKKRPKRIALDVLCFKTGRNFLYSYWCSSLSLQITLPEPAEPEPAGRLQVLPAAGLLRNQE